MKTRYIIIYLIALLILDFVSIGVAIYYLDKRYPQTTSPVEEVIKIDSVKQENNKLIIEVNNLDSIKNAKVIEVTTLDNDSTLKLFYQLIRK